MSKENDGLYYLPQKLELRQPATASYFRKSSVHLHIKVSLFPIFLLQSRMLICKEIWHYKPGHLSHFRIKLLQSFHSSNFMWIKSKFMYYICPLAGRKDFHFLLVLLHIQPFDLICNCDIWGPFSTSSWNGCHYFLTIVVTLGVHFMRSKDQTRYCTYSINLLFHLIETQFNSKIKEGLVIWYWLRIQHASSQKERASGLFAWMLLLHLHLHLH